MTVYVKVGDHIERTITRIKAHSVPEAEEILTNLIPLLRNDYDSLSIVDEYGLSIDGTTYLFKNTFGLHVYKWCNGKTMPVSRD